MRESKNIEFKETITNTFLKTVSAFANYGDGIILFGVNDNGHEIGLDNPKQLCMDIENRINDSIQPVPAFSLEITGKRIIKLTVYEGLSKPYFYKSKAYRRNDSATIEVDRTELTRLILEGENTSFEELESNMQNLTFNILESKLHSLINIEQLSSDTLKTLELLKGNGKYNNAGKLFADENDFCGIDIMRFGDSLDIILDHETFEKESVLLQYDYSLTMFQKYYQYEQIKGSSRETVDLIPEKAYREAIANAIVHRTWDIDTHINIAMFPDRIEITSPGGLPKGISKEEYLRGGLSILRNRIIGNIFLRLRLIERFGTGIRRINESYSKSEKKPLFEIYENSIKIILPVFQGISNLSNDENKVYSLVKCRNTSSSKIVEATGFGKSKVVSILNKLIDEGYMTVTGTGRGTKYCAC